LKAVLKIVLMVGLEGETFKVCVKKASGLNDR